MKKLATIVMGLAAVALAANAAVAATIIDDGGAGYGTAGTWNPGTSPNVIYNSNLQWAADAPGGDAATWSFSGLSSGYYNVYASIPGHGDGATAANYNVSDGVGNVTVDQTQQYTDVAFNDGTNYVGFGTLTNMTRANVTDGNLVVTLSGSSNYLYADAVAIVPELTPTALIDNGDSGFGTSGSWGSSVGNPLAPYYGNDIAWSSATSGDRATWSFSGLGNGTYQAYASWFSLGDATSSASYSGLDGGDITVNQKLNPDDVFINDGTRDIFFESLGKVTVTDGTATLSVTSNQAYLYADAVALQFAIPEPSTFLLAGLGALGLLLARRRRK